ncbi:MAG TPA: hypothetical protein VFV72_05065 [Candidatus Limnocylindrales bacterium]|nr:hypothetical protein [Candidatus Limnocylindrales bacterium]
MAAYTRGLPAEVRRDRADEIESDLWSEIADAAAGSGEGAVGKDILVRLLLGMPADIRWRFDQPPGAPGPVPTVGDPTMYARNISMISVIGGAAWAIWIAPAILFGDNAWVGTIGMITMFTLLIGSLGLSLATLGFVFGNIDRLHGIASLLGAIGGGFGLLLAGGVYWGMVLLPVGSAAVMWNLARLRVVSSKLAWAHAGSSVATSLLALPLLTNLIPPASAGVAVFVLLALALEGYALSWIAVGWSLRAGTWMQEEPATT